MPVGILQIHSLIGQVSLLLACMALFKFLNSVSVKAAPFLSIAHIVGIK